MDLNKPAIPCGVIAKSYFNDTFSLFNLSGEVKINETGIAWTTDVKTKYLNL